MASALNVLRRIAGWLVSSGWIYDGIQRVAGQAQLERKVRAITDRAIAAGALAVDLGGGTGLLAGMLPRSRYVCLDIDLLKLTRFRARQLIGRAVQADITHVPLTTGSADAAVCAKVLHHLTDAEVQQLASEAHRCLRPDGVLIVTDLVTAPRAMSRLLCYLDRGCFARRADEIIAALGDGFALIHSETFQLGVFHTFVLCVYRRSERGAAAVPRI